MVGKKKFVRLAYADNLVLMAKPKEKMKTVLERFSIFVCREEKVGDKCREIESDSIQEMRKGKEMQMGMGS